MAELIVNGDHERRISRAALSMELAGVFLRHGKLEAASSHAEKVVTLLAPVIAARREVIDEQLAKWIES